MRETNTQKKSDKTSKRKDKAPKGGGKPERGKDKAPKSKDKSPKGKDKSPKGKDKAPKGKDRAPKGKDRQGESDTATKDDRAARRERRRARKASLDHRQVLSRDEAVAYLETLLGAVRSGSVRLERNAETITLEVPGQLRVGVKASRSEKAEQLTLSLRWRRGSDAPLVVKHG